DLAFLEEQRILQLRPAHWRWNQQPDFSWTGYRSQQQVSEFWSWRDVSLQTANYRDLSRQPQPRPHAELKSLRLYRGRGHKTWNTGGLTRPDKLGISQ